MTVNVIADLEVGSSVRSKLNSLIGLANTSLINPVEFGAVGDGIADDSAALNQAIDEQNSTGRGIFLAPGKVFKIGSDLNAFTNGMYVVGGGTIKAPNAIRCLRHEPTGWHSGATQLAATSLSVVTWQSQQKVTSVNMTSTAGLVVGQWVKVGSSTINTPVTSTAEVNFWFELSQIRQIVTNTSITLDRHLEGHARGLLPDVHANYKVFGFPTTLRPVIVDVGFEADESSANIMATNLIDRRVFLSDGGSLNARIQVRGKRWWQALIVTHGILSEIDAAWEMLPDISDAAIPESNRSFGDGVLAHSGSHGIHARIRGGSCRHGFTTSVRDLGTYSSTVPYDTGLSFYSGTSPDSVVIGSSSSAYDTHAGFGSFLQGRTAASAEHQDSSSSGLAAQDRGFNTTIAIKAIGPYWRGIQLFAAGSNFSALGENVTLLNDCEFRAVDSSPGSCHIVIVGDVQANNTIIVKDPVFQGSKSGFADAVQINAGFAGKLVLNNPQFRDYSGNLIHDVSGLCCIEIHGGQVVWRNSASALRPFLVDVAAANRGDGTTGDWVIHGLYLEQVSSGVPNGLFQISSNLNVNLRCSRILTQISGIPLRSASSPGSGQLLVSGFYDAAELAPFQNASGSMAAASPGRNWKLTGNVTSVPITNGWWANLVNTSGANRSITPASGVCVVVEMGATAGSVSVANNKGVHAVADGTNLLIFGDVI